MKLTISSDFLIGQWREQRQHLFDTFAQVERTVLDDHFAGFDFGKIQDVVDDGQQRRGRFVDGLDVLALFLIESGLAQQGGEADHAVHRGADFMADIGQELGFGAARDDGAFARQIQFDVLDFHRLQRLAQFRRGQIDLFLKLTLRIFQGIGHGVDALFQHAKFTAGDDRHTRPQLTGFQFAHGVGQSQHRFADSATDPQCQDSADGQSQQGQQQAVDDDLRLPGGGGGMRHMDNHPAQQFTRVGSG